MSILYRHFIRLIPQFRSITLLSRQLSIKSSVDPGEINRFRQLSSSWWNETGAYTALHSLNQLRIPFIREQLVQSSSKIKDILKPLKDLQLLDIGCGGGILTEPLARLGASILGIDAVSENIYTAEYHADPSLKENLNYKHVTLEELCENVEQIEKYDAVIASEVIEHINDVDTFIANISKLLKPKGLCFITTLNQTMASYFLGIIAAEYILRMVPPGTHTWNKFVRPSDLITLFEKNDFNVVLNNGMFYNPIINRWSWSESQAINYALCAAKN
ncbi:unnamed protein product [Rotaria sordida]|uniref:Ubiquinone biosynthesis O-methyltransferase, mitochondrial n=1 Tax=Rotaria sordida TaxID=392033 RepID=A0A819ALM3_9BILA|nr:unnamed protein product [Rotaria sordida]CAF0798458.1 unnamed protein product [Rotaria sordida]CAF0862369.1 unnamed protein product [Rotaria sordida]CAF1388815.1 unnamed protein product [Rotaria sordida]CAF3786018.1 unnamed protein product [Rotaria sordida]